MFANKTLAEHGKYYMFIAKTSNIFHCLVQKHDPNSMQVFAENDGKYMHNYSTMFSAK